MAWLGKIWSLYLSHFTYTSQLLLQNLLHPYNTKHDTSLVLTT